MRITEDGRVGIGTEKPETTLDVAGTVRVSEGIKFSDGTTLAASSGKLTVRDAAGEVIAAPDAAGIGSTNSRGGYASDSRGGASRKTGASERHSLSALCGGKAAFVN